MKIKEYKEIKNKEIKDLNKMLKEKREVLRKVILDIKTGTEKNLKKGANLRNEIAKILTIIKEKEIIERIKKEEEKKQK